MTTPQSPEQFPSPSGSPEGAASDGTRADDTVWAAPGSPAQGSQPENVAWGTPGPADHAPVEAQPSNAAAPGEAQPFTPGAPQPGDNNTRKLLVAGTTGAVVGALVVGILWAASSFVGQSGDGAAEDAAAACGVFQRVPSDWKPETVTEANTYRLGAGIALAQAAGKADQKYVTLATQAQQVQQAVVSFQVGRIAQLVVDVRNTCNDL